MTRVQTITKGLQNGNTIINRMRFNCGTALQNMPSPMKRQDSGNMLQNGVHTPVVYPNPTTGILRVDTHSGDPIDFMALYAIDGQLLFATETNSSCVEEIDMSVYPSGQYMLVLKIGRETYSEKIILNK